MGQYPDDLTNLSPLNIGRGRLIPTLPFEAPWNAVVQWLGVTSDDELDKILPNRKSFPGMMLSEQEVFAQKRWSPPKLCKGEGEEVSCRRRRGGTETETDDDNDFHDDYYDDNYDDNNYPNDDDDYDDFRSDDYGKGNMVTKDDNNSRVVIISTVIPVLLLIGAGGTYIYFAYHRRSLTYRKYKYFKDDSDDLNATDISGDDLSIEESTGFNLFHYKNNDGVEIATD